LGCEGLDPSVDLDPIQDHRRHDRPGQLAGSGIGLDLGQLALQDRGRGSLPEVRLEDRGERDAPPRAQAADAVARLRATVSSPRHLSCRRRRRGP
jgi:hypothetical protein